MPLAFVCEFIDSTIGMGYGTSLTPILLLMGFEPLQIVPAVLLSEFISGVTAACFHHSLKNADLRPSSRDGRVAGALAIFSVVGTVLGVALAIKLSPQIVKIVIGAIVAGMGVFIFVMRNRKIRFSWSGISVLGTLASFNKGISGGGYGPLVMGGQLLSGVGVKNAVGITSLAEGITCFVGVIVYALTASHIDWSLAPWLMAGAILSVPLAAHTLKRLPERQAKLIVAAAVFFLGCLTLSKGFG